VEEQAYKRCWLRKRNPSPLHTHGLLTAAYRRTCLFSPMSGTILC
jgi:hypothetical protein